jgi:hypothetical protein
MQAGAQCLGGGGGTGQNQRTGRQHALLLVQQAGDFRQRTQRLAQNGGAAAYLHRAAIKAQHHAQVIQCRLRRAERANHITGGRAVVGHHVLQAETEVAITRVDDFQRRGHTSQRQPGFGQRQGTVDVDGGDEGDFRLHPWVNQFGQIQPAAIGQLHGIGQFAPDQRVHAHLYHLGAAGKAQFQTHHALATLLAQADAGLLDAIGSGQIKRLLRTQLRGGFVALGGDIQLDAIS